jgi:UDP-N-acetylmuramate dehydrogenase
MSDALPVALVDTIRARLGGRTRPGEPLARHTSFRIGGPADLLVLPDTAEELAHVLATAAAFGARVTLLGGGSNVLVGDGGMRGVVVKLGRGFARIEWEAGRASAGGSRAGVELGRAADAARALEGSAAPAARAPDGPPDNFDGASIAVRAGAAVQLGRLARAAVARGLAGLEYAEGIPGTVGGALFMNAGAYGGELAHAVESVEGLDRDGRALELPGHALLFGYRRSALPSGFVVTAVRLHLRRDGSARERMEEARARRTATQPHGRANAGSIFKNPNGDHAGRLIELAGLKGARAGHARISERHANFIVNEGGARAADVKALMDVAQRVVWERSGVWLEPEVQLVGSW